jgi:hypothetical protein
MVGVAPRDSIQGSGDRGPRTTLDRPRGVCVRVNPDADIRPAWVLKEELLARMGEIKTNDGSVGQEGSNRSLSPATPFASTTLCRPKALRRLAGSPLG